MDTTNKQIMANNIKRQMEKKGVSNQQICDDLGFKYTTFLDWIKGVTYPRIGKIEAMADYFGILKSDLIEEKTEEHREMQKKNDVLSDIVYRLQKDDNFLSVVTNLYNVDSEKLELVKNLLNAFSATEK